MEKTWGKRGWGRGPAGPREVDRVILAGPGTASDLPGQMNRSRPGALGRLAPKQELISTSDPGASSPARVRPGLLRASLLYTVIFLVVNGTGSMGMEFSTLSCQRGEFTRYQAVTSR